jgi:hypothetical protein
MSIQKSTPINELPQQPPNFQEPVVPQNGGQVQPEYNERQFVPVQQSHSQDQHPGQFQGQPPGQFQGQPPGQFQGQPPGQFQGQPPGQFQGQPPGQFQGQPPGQFQGQPPGQIQGQPPGQPQDKKNVLHQKNPVSGKKGMVQDILSNWKILLICFIVLFVSQQEPLQELVRKLFRVIKVPENILFYVTKLVISLVFVLIFFFTNRNL